jgi:hypothetical protein
MGGLNEPVEEVRKGKRVFTEEQAGLREEMSCTVDQ